MSHFNPQTQIEDILAGNELLYINRSLDPDSSDREMVLWSWNLPSESPYFRGAHHIHGQVAQNDSCLETAA